MTNKIKGLTVALTHDLHEADCQKIIDSIKRIKGVEGVEMHVPLPAQDFLDEVAAQIKELQATQVFGISQ